MKNKRNSERDVYRLLKNKLLIRIFGMLFFAFAFLAALYSLFLKGHIADTFVGFLDNFVYHDYDRAYNVYSIYVRDYMSLFFVVLSLLLFAIILRFSPKFGAIIQTIPQPLLGGVSIVVFGLIAVAGARIWVVNQVDFGNNRNLIVAAVTLILGAGDFTINIAGITLGGIGTATFGAILLNALMNRGSSREGEPLIER